MKYWEIIADNLNKAATEERLSLWSGAGNQPPKARISGGKSLSCQCVGSRRDDRSTSLSQPAQLL